MSEIEQWLPTAKSLDMLSGQINYRHDWIDIVFVVLCILDGILLRTSQRILDCNMLLYLGTNRSVKNKLKQSDTIAPLVIIGDESNRMALLHIEPNTITFSSFKVSTSIVSLNTS